VSEAADGARVGALVHGTFFFIIIFPGARQYFADVGLSSLSLSSCASPRIFRESMLERQLAGRVNKERRDRTATMQIFMAATVRG
jgi:hypothetical protein